MNLLGRKSAAGVVKLLMLLPTLVVVFGCATSSPPNARDFAVIPVIRAGSNAATGTEHIVRIAAGAPVPIQLRIEGDLLVADVVSTVMATFKRNIYLYKDWASFDGKDWKRTHELIEVDTGGGFDKSGGLIAVKLKLPK